ncbi:hypothetical protein [Coraliomargarita parva]|uniref:hypothetical protein n=1 Tax=Coraliomargarita parva TaxID=3014050 RepID=UPI0022B2E519|nr:hypothetical protein [Coraliomargarita parva]
MNTCKLLKYSGLLLASNLTFILTPTEASTVTFSAWQDSGVNQNTSTSETAVLTQDGVTFTLAIESVGTQPSPSNITALNGGVGDRLGVRNGLDNGGLDSGATVLETTTNGVDTSDDEALKFSLTVSGATLTSLSLEGFQLLSWGLNESLTFSDGTTAFDFTSDGSDSGLFNYAGDTGIVVMTGLTGLTIANVGGQGSDTWELTVYARDKLEGGDSTSTGFGIDSISFNYTVAVPEPALAGSLLGLGALGLVVYRRKRR